MPQFDQFLRTTYGNFNRDSPTRNRIDNRMGTSSKKFVLNSPKEKVGFLKKNLKTELRTLKVFTIIDKKSGELEEIERDLVSLHHEMPNYFSKPKLHN